MAADDARESKDDLGRVDFEDVDLGLDDGREDGRDEDREGDDRVDGRRDELDRRCPKQRSDKSTV